MEWIRALELKGSLSEFFLVCALLGGSLFTLQWLLLLFGITTEGMGEGIDLPSFKWISQQAFTGFILFFGAVGLTCSHQFHLSQTLSIFLAALGGIFAVMSGGYLIRLSQKLHSQGSHFTMEKTLGQTGTVYQKISKNSTGKISLIIEGITYEVEATSEEEEIPSFTPVRVIKIKDPHTVVVQTKEPSWTPPSST